MVDAAVVQQLTMHAKNSITSRSAACAFSGAFGGPWDCLGFTSDRSVSSDHRSTQYMFDLLVSISFLS
jgi:hypothetical protein